MFWFWVSKVEVKKKPVTVLVLLQQHSNHLM